MANINAKIIENGEIKEATKLPVITIGLGPVFKLQDLDGVVWRVADGNVILRTKEAPEGCLYNQARTVVVRIIGGQVKINGLYDIYAPAPEKIGKLLSNPFELWTLPLDQRDDLAPLLEVASEIKPSLAPSEPGRKVIIITKEMMENSDYIECHCSWDPETTLTKLYEGDIFLVEDAETCKGYRIGKEEFWGTHALSD